MSLYAQYIKERLNKEIIEDEKGFATYFFLQDGIYIEDIYTSPDFRHSRIASGFADQIAKIAKSKGFSKLYGSIVPSAKNSTDSMKVLLAYGFQLESCNSNMIMLVKEI